MNFGKGVLYKKKNRDIETFYFFANSVDTDQTPRQALSDLGLHCLPMSLLWA